MTNTHQKPDRLIVTDPRRAALLLTKGCTLVDCPPSKYNPGQMTYEFDDTANKARLAMGAIASNEALPIADFLNNLRKTNELLYLWRQSKEAK
jgi:hypothetical protein